MQILVVGAGLSGCTVARLMAEAGHAVTLIDERDKVGGNCSDRTDENGILYHEYGPHLFHTNDENVFRWLSRFTEWVPYRHKVKAMLDDGTLVPFPVNAETLKIVPKEKIVDVFFRPYTEKMWGMPLEKVSPSILSRVPAREDFVDEYFPKDVFQFMPKLGFQAMFDKMVAHENIVLKLNERYSKNWKNGRRYDLTFNSMSIDEYFEFKYGKLEYRSVRFHHYDLPLSRVFPVVTVNFTNKSRFTRVTEWKNIPNASSCGKNSFYTKITVEEPCDAEENSWRRFYPVPDLNGKNVRRYLRYEQECPDDMIFIGRCGKYKYLNMDQAVKLAMEACQEWLG